MSIFVPGDPRVVLGRESPIIGSVTEIVAVSRFLEGAGKDAERYRISLQLAAIQLERMQGEAIDRIREKARDRLPSGALILQESTGLSKRGIDEYAQEVDRIHQAARNSHEEVEAGLGVVRQAADDISEIAQRIGCFVAYAWQVGAPGQMPQPQLAVVGRGVDPAQAESLTRFLQAQYEMSWLGAAVRWHSALERIGEAKQRWLNLIVERQNAEGRLLGHLADAPVQQLIDLAPAGSPSAKFSIAVGLTGELWGQENDSAELAMSHPLLLALLGTEDGRRVWDHPPDPAAVAAAWAGLSGEDRERLLEEVPWVVGNLPGLPFDARNAANRNTVAFYSRFPQLLSADQLKLLSGIQRILTREAEQIAEYGAGRPVIRLVALDPLAEVPRAAVGYGDLDSATHHTWEAPGMENDAVDGLDGWDRASRNLLAAQNRLVGSSRDTAAVAWCGYDTPDVFSVLGSEKARAGAARLAAELDGAHASRAHGGGAVPMTTVLAHSYGTTMAAIALTLVRYPVDAFVMMGSAGLDTRLVPQLSELRVREHSPGQPAVFSTHASGDQLAPLGAALSGRGLPNPEATAPFGLERWSPVYGGALFFPAEGDPALGLKRTDGHSTIGSGAKPGVLGMTASEGHGYLDPDTQSLVSVAKISLGRIDPKLERSFVRTEAACPVLLPPKPAPILRPFGLPTPERVRCEDGHDG